MKEKIFKYKILLTIVLMIFIAFGATYAWFYWTSNTNYEVSFMIDGLGITYNGEETTITSSLYPTANMTNPDNVIHEFSLVATANADIYSRISLEIITLPDELKHESFRYDLYKGETKIAKGSFVNAKEGQELIITPYEKITNDMTDYTLYIWIDGANYYNPVSMLSKSFVVNLKIDAAQEKFSTDESCFAFDVINGITNYLCYDGNDQDLPIITDIVIPETINGHEVTTIGANSMYNKDLTSVIIPGSVTTIGNNAFRGNQLSTIALPDNLITIGGSAFRDNQLKNVALPNSLTTIGPAVFQDNELISVTIPDSVTTIGNSAFYNNQLESVVINEGVTTIGSSAFAGNKLSNLVIPKGVTTIDSGAFASNILTTVVINEGVTTIGYSAFNNNPITSLILPNSITTIGSYAFYRAHLTDLILPKNLVSIDMYAFCYNNLTNITIPENVTSIGVGAFYGNKLTSLTFSNGVTTIGNSAFCSNLLTNIVLPDSVTTIGNEVFRYNQLRNVYIGTNSLLSSIGQNTFANQSNNGGLITIYNNSGKTFDWTNAVTGTAGEAFEIGSVTGATITTGGNP